MAEAPNRGTALTVRKHLRPAGYWEILAAGTGWPPETRYPPLSPESTVHDLQGDVMGDKSQKSKDKNQKQKDVVKDKAAKKVKDAADAKAATPVKPKK
jgi:thiol:disulfide interchange protein